jgi:hypothetical protein
VRPPHAQALRRSRSVIVIGENDDGDDDAPSPKSDTPAKPPPPSQPPPHPATPSSAAPATTHPRSALRARGWEFLGDVASADVFVRAVPLGQAACGHHTSPDAAHPVPTPPTTPAAASAFASASASAPSASLADPGEEIPRHITLRARVSPRDPSRRPFLLQRQFDLDALRAAVPSDEEEEGEEEEMPADGERRTVHGSSAAAAAGGLRKKNMMLLDARGLPRASAEGIPIRKCAFFFPLVISRVALPLHAFVLDRWPSSSTRVAYLFFSHSLVSPHSLVVGISILCD